MPQGLGKNLYQELSVRENLDFFGMLYGQSRSDRHARIERLTKATGLVKFLNRPAGKLSGGMKQKLGLCCALIHEPDFLILDEPTTGVGPPHSSEVSPCSVVRSQQRVKGSLKHRTTEATEKDHVQLKN